MSAGTKGRGKTRTRRNDLSTVGKNPTAPPFGQGSQFVYETLRKEILDLTLEPGSHLDDQSLSEQFDLSRTPVREALVRIAAESEHDRLGPELRPAPSWGGMLSDAAANGINLVAWAPS